MDGTLDDWFSARTSNGGKRHIALYGLALFGALNLALGLALAVWQPARASDLWTIYDWCYRWLYDGARLYRGAAAPDYPPNAIVTYAFLATIPASLVVSVWALTSLAVTPFLPYAVLRFVSPRVRLSSALVPIVLFVCWGGSRTILQFSKVSFLLAIVAVTTPRRSIAGGVCLGLALAKPHIAGPIALWAACRGRFRTTVVATALVFLQYAIYCFRAAVDPLHAALGWMRALQAQYTGTTALDGHTSIRPWVTSLINDAAMADAIWVSIAVITLIALCVAAVRDRTNSLAIPALLCLWSLLTIYHNLNNLLLVLPAFIFLLTIDDPGSRSQRFWMIGIIQAALMLDIPVRFGHVADDRLRPFVVNVDRLVVLGTFVLVASLWLRRQRTAAPTVVLAASCASE